MKRMELVRGDTEKIKITYWKGWDKYEPNFIEDGDIYTLTFRDKRKNEVVLSKSITYPENEFTIEHEDTKDLEIKDYKFDIEVRRPDTSMVKTLVVGQVFIQADITLGDE